MSLENFIGNLCDGYKQLQPGTMLHVDQLMNERRANADLRDQCFYTADGEVYFLDGSNIPTLAITREAQNPVLQHINNAFVQLVNNHNYRLCLADVQQALAAPETVFVALPNLRLSKYDSEFQYLALGTTPAKYNNLNDEERKLAERVYGQGDDFTQNMKMLKDAKINETSIFVLNPDYVQKQAEEGAVARASWLYGFFINSQFSADDRSVDYHFRVRGVRRGSEVIKAPSGCDAQNLGPYKTAVENPLKAYYDAILADPDGARKVLTDETASGMLNIVSSYLASKR